jgi:hypothetical protein
MRGSIFVLALAWLFAGPVCPVSAAAVDVGQLIAPYLRARDDRAVGEVAGQALADPPRPRAAAAPYTDVAVLLLPYSPSLEVELDRVKEHYRDSLDSYMGAVAEVVAARAAHEDALLWAGGGELIRGEVSDASGGVRLAQVPAGEWILLAWRDVLHPGKAPKQNPGDFAVPISTGYSVVTFWRMRLQVRAGATTEISLNDRNVWLTGIREDLAVVKPPAKKKDALKRR